MVIVSELMKPRFMNANAALPIHPLRARKPLLVTRVHAWMEESVLKVVPEPVSHAHVLKITVGGSAKLVINFFFFFFSFILYQTKWYFKATLTFSQIAKIIFK